MKITEKAKLQILIAAFLLYLGIDCGIDIDKIVDMLIEEKEDKEK